jgi:hypothetical protein
MDANVVGDVSSIKAYIDYTIVAGFRRPTTSEIRKDPFFL